jgi:FlaA1/EpsC-like NDP-sugar epimerase/lipopolysaccharide/colanic/teichoic acid biosynthesis glycosyltransferase
MFTFLKRALDIFLATIGIVVCLPLFPIVALFIKLDSKGPIFYVCGRLGKGRRRFKMYKFRTMSDTPIQVGTSLSPLGDVRVTDFGRILRRLKLNELPQLINILKGEMSFVGPRPEAPDLAELYPPEAEVLFSVKPGLVGPAQIANRNEEELFPEGVDPRKYYIEHILPGKLKVDLEYVGQPNFLKDLKYILLAIKETLFGVISRRHFFENRSQIYLLVLDVFLVACSYMLAILLRFEGTIPAVEFRLLIKVIPIYFSYRIICFIWFGLYGVLIRYLDFQSYTKVVKAVTVSSLLSAITIYGAGFFSFPRSILIIDWLCLNFLMLLVRHPGKVIRDRIYGKEDEGKKKVLIYGAGDRGHLAAIELKWRVKIIGFLDDDRTKRNKKIQEFKVLGSRYDIEPLAKIYQVDEVVLAVANLDEQNLSHVISLCNKSKVSYSMFTTMVDTHLDRMRGEQLRTQRVATWAGTHDFEMNFSLVDEKFSQKGVLLIGPSNVIGFELLKHLATLQSKEVVILDRYESYLNEIFARSLSFFPKEKVRPYLSSEPLPAAAEKIFSDPNPPGIIIHMGTRKYVSSMPFDPLLIARENILNTWDLWELSKRKKCQLFLMVSAIGAEKPKNFIQATLRLTEQYLQDYKIPPPMTTVTVRLFNLVENRGALVHRIQSQIREKNRIILNHPEEERYFLTSSSAAKLVLVSASLALENGMENQGIFMPSTNGRVKISDLARLIASDYGLDEKDIEIEYIGSGDQGGWKEELRLDGKKVERTPYENVVRIVPSPCFSSEQITEDIRTFRQLVDQRDRGKLVEMVNHRVGIIGKDDKQ